MFFICDIVEYSSCTFFVVVGFWNGQAGYQNTFCSSEGFSVTRI